MPSVPGIHRLTLPGAERERWIGELRAIKAAGFNSIRLPVEWRSTEPERGQYRFDRIGDLLTIAADTDLRVIVQVDARGPAGCAAAIRIRRLSPAGKPERKPRPYHRMDHPGVRADLGAFIGGVATAAARYRRSTRSTCGATPACLPRQPPNSATARIPARFRDALQRRYRTLPALNAAWRRLFTHGPACTCSSRTAAVELSDWRQFVAVKLQEHSVSVGCVRAARRTAGHEPHRCRPRVPDPWLMTSVVDYYGTLFAAPIGEPARVLAALDTLRSGGRDKSWWLGSISVGSRGANVSGTNTTGGPLRLWAWAAIARARRRSCLFVVSLVRDFGQRRAKPGFNAHRRRWPGSSVATVPSLHRCARILPESRSCGV